MILLIRDQLTCPPSWFYSYRDLTLFCETFLKLDILIESDDIDAYYKWIKNQGGMDFVKDFVKPGIETGLRIDFEIRYSPTIKINKIVPENVQFLIGSIKKYVDAPPLYN